MFQKRKSCDSIFILSVGVSARSSRAGKCAAWDLVTLIAKPVNSCRMITERPKLVSRPVSSRISVGVEDNDSAVVWFSGTAVALGVSLLLVLFAPLLVAAATEKD